MSDSSCRQCAPGFWDYGPNGCKSEETQTSSHLTKEGLAGRLEGEVGGEVGGKVGGPIPACSSLVAKYPWA